MKYSIILFLLLLIGCGNKTENEIIHDIRNSYKYKFYNGFMDKTSKIIVDSYNEKAGTNIQLNDVHSVLAMTWYLADCSEFSIVESDTLMKSDRDYEQFVGGCMIVLNLSKVKCPNLAHEKLNEVRNSTYYKKMQITNTCNNNDKLTAISLIIIGIREGDMDMVKIGGDFLNAMCKLNYPSKVATLCYNVKTGDIKNAFIDLNDLNNDKDFEIHKNVLKIELSKCMNEMREGKINASEAFEKILAKFGKSMMDDIMNSAENKDVKNIIDNIEKKLDGPKINILQGTPEPSINTISASQPSIIPTR